jgi:uncharacterized membrane protein
VAERVTWLERAALRREWTARTNVVLLVVWFGVALAEFQQLPERIPLHFLPGGSPTRWEPATLPRWLLLPAIAAALAAVLPLVEKLHLTLNRPYGIEPADPHRRASWNRLRRTFLDLCTTLVIVSFAALHAGGWLVATGRAPAIPAPLLAVAFGAIAAVLGLLVPLQRALSRVTGTGAAEPAWDAARNGADAGSEPRRP